MGFFTVMRASFDRLCGYIDNIGNVVYTVIMSYWDYFIYGGTRTRVTDPKNSLYTSAY